MAKVFGAVEAGGTKFVCAAGTGPDDIVLSDEISSEKPAETMAGIAAFFARFRVKRLGIACFGPLDLAAGKIARTTPKRQWRNFPIRAELEAMIGAPAVLDTDVNGAAWGEYLWGAGQGVDPLVYLTVGTGIGGGAVVNGALVHGLLHPEMGHLLVPPPEGDRGRGVCEKHAHCIEGFASGPAIAARGFNYDQAADALGAAIHNYTCVLSPRRVLIGGGVMKHKGMLTRIRQAARRHMNGYAPLPEILAPQFGQRAGTVGALALAMGARKKGQ